MRHSFFFTHTHRPLYYRNGLLLLPAVELLTGKLTMHSCQLHLSSLQLWSLPNSIMGIFFQTSADIAIWWCI